MGNLGIAGTDPAVSKVAQQKRGFAPNPAPGLADSYKRLVKSGIG
jgi:hypothetical protein